MADLSALVTATTAATALSNLILVSPQSTIGYQPQNVNSIGGTAALGPAILFNYEGEQAAVLESDITDHYIEDNTAIQDQIALRPETVTTHGFIGELNDVVTGTLATAQKIAQSVVSKFTTISAYTPVLSETAILAYNEAFFAYQIAASAENSAVSAWASLNSAGGESVIGNTGLISQPNQNKQQTYFQQFYGYWRNRTLFTVQTPWAVFQNMAIQSLRAIQDAETNVITDFEIKFKMIRLASAVSTTPQLLAYDRAATQSSDLVNNGTQTPLPGPAFSPTFSASQVS